MCENWAKKSGHIKVYPLFIFASVRNAAPQRTVCICLCSVPELLCVMYAVFLYQNTDKTALAHF